MPFVSSGRTLTVGAGQQYAKLSAAVASSKPGDTIQVNAGVYLNDSSIIKHDLKIVGVGGQAHLKNTTAISNGKGILVVAKGADVVIESMEFSGAKVADQNGAGIRLDSGTLEVKNSYFHNNENGILTASVATSSVKIDGSEFAFNGYGDGYTHGIYVGKIASLAVTNSYFHDTKVGHHIKSRAAVSTITDNRLMDGDGDASYNIDLPNAGKAIIKGNIIEQGAKTDNPAMIAYGAEASKGLHAGSSLLVQDNTFINHSAKSVGVSNKTAVTAQVTGNDFHQVTTPVSGPSKQSSNTIDSDLSDVVLVRASGDFYLDDPEFTVVVDGGQVGGTNVVTADRAEGEWQTFAFEGNWGADGPNEVKIRYGNDVSSGVGKDRNLYVDWVEANGVRHEPTEAVFVKTAGGTLAGVEKLGIAGQLLFDGADLIA